MAEKNMKTKTSQTSTDRQGAVTVEFALVCSMLFLFLFAGMEFGRVNMIRNTVEAAAYEGARVGIIPGATKAECQQAAIDYLTEIGIQTSIVDVQPANLDDAPDVTVTIDVPLDGSNVYVFPTFFAGKKIVSTISLPRERSIDGSPGDTPPPSGGGGGDDDDDDD